MPVGLQELLKLPSSHVVERAAVNDPQQAQEIVLPCLQWCGGEKDETVGDHPDLAAQCEVRGFSIPHVVGLINDREIEGHAALIQQRRRVKEPSSLKRCDHGEGLVVPGALFPGKLLEIALPPLDEVDAEPVAQLGLPLLHKVCGANHQEPAERIPRLELLHDQRGFNGLPQADFIRDEEPARVVLTNELQNWLELVGQELCLRPAH